MNDFSFVFYIVSALMFVIILAILIEDKNYKKIYKRIALLIPTFVGISIFMYLVNDIRISLKINQSIGNINRIIDNLNKDNVIELIESIKKINTFDSAGMAMFSLLATVWIGLNIYNLIEKKDLDDIKENSIEMKKKIEEYENQMSEIIQESNKKLSDYNYELERMKKQYKIDLYNELYFDSQIEYVNGNTFYNKVKFRFNEYIKLLDDDKMKKDVIRIYISDSLSKALDISNLTTKIIEKNVYCDVDDVDKLLECAYATEHCVEKLSIFIEVEDYYVKKILKEALSDYKKIKYFLNDTEDKSIDSSIKKFKHIMDKAIIRYDDNDLEFE